MFNHLWRNVMKNTEEQKALDEELFRECMGYDDKPDGAYIEVEERYQDQSFRGKKFFNLNKIKRLIKVGANVNAKTKYGNTPLHLANHQYIFSISIELSKLLIDSGADVGAKNNDGGTPLNLAVQVENIELAKLLIYRGANCRNGYLRWAILMGNEDLVEYLISARADVNCRDCTGETPLHTAIRRSRNGTTEIEVAKLLIASGANVRAKDVDGWTALHFVKNIELAKLLICAGADVNAKSNSGITPLHFVNSIDLAKLLISAGANVNCRDEKNKSVLYNVIDKGNIELANFLREHGAIE